MTPYQKLLKLHGKTLVDMAVSQTGALRKYLWYDEALTLVDVLNATFAWQDSPQGYDFWRAIEVQILERGL